MILLGIVAGAAVIWLGIQLAKRLDRRANEAEVASRDGDSGDEYTISVAGVSGDLVPLVSGITHQTGARIELFGEDGAYVQLDRKGQEWLTGMKRWIAEGWNVTYTILYPDETTKDMFLKLMEDVGEDALTVYVVDHERATSETSEVKDLIEERRTFHPNLIYNGADGKGMWVEGTHMAGSEYAYNVEYVSPTAMTPQRQREFEQYEKENKLIRRYSTRLRPVAGVA